MTEVKDSSTLLSDGPVMKAIGSIAVPMMIMMTTNVGFSFLDAWYVSRLGPDALNAIDICFPLINIASAILYGGLGTGVSAAVARKYALKEKDSTETALKTGFALVIPLVIFFMISINVFRSTLFSGAKNEASANMAYEYCFWYFLFIIIMAFGAVASSAMRGAGYAKKPAIYSLICMLADGLLTPLFTFDFILGMEIGLGMGMKGAALSTVVAYTLFTVLLFKDLIKGSQGISITSFRWRVDKVILNTIFKASAIAALLPMVTNIMIYVILNIMSFRSHELVDAFSLAKRFELYLIQLTVCLGAGTMVVMGASSVTVNTERMAAALKGALKILFGVGIPIVIAMAFFNQYYFRILTQDALIIEEGNRYFVYGGFNMLFCCAIILMNFCFQGIGRPAGPIPFSLFSVFVIHGFCGWWLISSGVSVNYYYALISSGSVITFLLIYRRFLKSI